ncbi:alpha/beta hydrolase [Bifidobacterium sp. UBA744]|uniref:alpha/beta hydrolase n=1 Tax=Bifidobacterium sp. UBA744 TaxID=1946112 RepID=UPI0025C22A50|nr:alpha/beta hydrolase [Bifidobacterium sp. UBA744]
MRLIDETIDGIDGTVARFRGYLIDNSSQMDPDRVRPAVLILPGGAYAHTSPREAEPIALKMIGYGYQAFILDYSCAPSVYPVALLETAEAMKRIREHAAQWHIDPGAIVIAGFSAGGHAAALFSEQWDNEAVIEHEYTPERIRPNGLMLGYPVISAGPYAHRDSIDNLLGRGRRRDPEWLDQVSLELHADAGHVPQTFLWTTVTDQAVDVRNSMLFANALIEAGVNVELHVFPTGGHGSSLGTPETDNGSHSIGDLPCVSVWPSLFDRWVQDKFPAATSWKSGNRG